MRSQRTAALAACALSATAILGAAFIADPGSEFIHAAALVGAGALVAAVGVWLLAFRRLRALTLIAERLATGDLEASVGEPGQGMVGRLERAINLTAARLTESHDAATTDRLTQIPNRGSVVATLIQEVGRAERHDRPLSIAFVDIDHFKDINDMHGHQVGDDVLRIVAGIFRSNLRASDVVGRYGGEEFMLVLPESTPEEATDVAEKARIMVERHRFQGKVGSPVRVTISIGIAGGSGRALQVDPLIRAADQAMYAAKSLGRNQTYVFREPDDGARVVGAPISAVGRARALEIGAVGRHAAEMALSAIVTPLPHYRGKPSSLIATISVELARDLGLAPQEVERIRVASLLHDIGKLAVPDDILEKPAPLTDAEWSFVRQHPRIGQLIIDEAGGLRDAGRIILHHHERFGGHGYPHGLRGKAIPLGSRIVAIADAYDAMIHDRPYKRAMDHEGALVELRRHSISQFDPDLVNLFVRRFADIAPVPDLTLVTPIAPTAILNLPDLRAFIA
ncbi:MAG: diguanylate cyclase [Candidatus Limnocylindrales bacterium]